MQTLEAVVEGTDFEEAALVLCGLPASRSTRTRPRAYFGRTDFSLMPRWGLAQAPSTTVICALGVAVIVGVSVPFALLVDGGTEVLSGLMAFSVLGLAVAALITAYSRATGTPVLLIAYLGSLLLSFVNYSQTSSLEIGESDLVAVGRLAFRLVTNGVILLVVVTAATATAAQSPNPRPVGREWPVILFAVGAGLSIPWSSLPVVSLGRWLDLFLFLGAAYGLARTRAYAFHNFSHALFLSLLVVLAGLWAWWLLSPEDLTRVIFQLDGSSQGRFGGNVLAPNTVGALGGVLAITATWVLRYERSRFVICLAVIALAMGATTVVASGSRGAALATAAAVCIAALLVVRSTKLLLISGAALVFWLSAISSEGDVVEYVADAFLARSPGDVSYLDLTGRFSLWSELLDDLREQPARLVFGHGIATIPESITVGSLETRSAHNGYLEALAGIGLIGIVSSIPLLLRIALDTGARVPRDVGLALSVMTILVLHNVTELGALVTMNPFTVVLIAIAAATRDEPRANMREPTRRADARRLSAASRV